MAEVVVLLLGVAILRDAQVELTPRESLHRAGGAASRRCGLSVFRTLLHDRVQPGKFRNCAAAAAIVVLVGLCCGTPAAALPVITDAVVRQHESATRVQIQISEHVPFSVFTLDRPDRVVVDLPEVRWALPDDVSPAPAGVFQRMRYGRYQAGTFRLVLDTSAPVQVSETSIRPSGGAFRLMLDLTPAAAGNAVSPPPPAAMSGASLATVIGATGLPGDVGAIAPAPRPAMPDASQRDATTIASAVLFATPIPRPRDTAPSNSPPQWIVAVDAGHGGQDPGAIGLSSVYEKQITLAVALALREQLKQQRRYKVVLTRRRDVFIRLRDRIAIARAAGADLFLSLHADKMPNPEVRGLSVYTLSEQASDAEAAALAERENKADLIAGVNFLTTTPDVTDILINLAQRDTMNQSARLASLLVAELRQQTLLLPRTHRFAGFAVLKAPDVPSVLIELGYLSNRDDEALLRTPQHRKKLARAIAQAVDQYFARAEARSRM